MQDFKLWQPQEDKTEPHTWKFFFLNIRQDWKKYEIKDLLVKTCFFGFILLYIRRMCWTWYASKVGKGLKDMTKNEKKIYLR